MVQRGETFPPLNNGKRQWQNFPGSTARGKSVHRDHETETGQGNQVFCNNGGLLVPFRDWLAFSSCQSVSAPLHLSKENLTDREITTRSFFKTCDNRKEGNKRRGRKCCVVCDSWWAMRNIGINVWRNEREQTDQINGHIGGCQTQKRETLERDGIIPHFSPHTK